MRGAALPFAVTLTMVIFFLITVQTAQVNYNLRLVQGASERTRIWYMAKSVVNEAIARLNDDPAFSLPTPEAPFRTEQNGFVLTAWVVPDPNSPDLLHVRGRAWPVGNEGAVQEFSRVIVSEPPIEAVVFSSGASSLGVPTSIFRAVAGSPSWELLPQVPNMYYDVKGHVQNVAGDFGTMVGWLAADQRGHTYSVYYPRMGNGFIAQLAAQYTIRSIAQMPRGVELMTEHGRSMDQYAGQIEDILQMGNRVPSILRYSTQTNSWDALPPLPAPDANGNPKPSDYLMPGMPVTVAGGKDNVYAGVIHKGQDYIYAFDAQSESWNIMSRPPGQNALRDLTADAQGNVYAQWSPAHSSGAGTGEFYKYDGSEWSKLPTPPRTFDGVTIPADAKLGQLTSSPKGELFATFWGSNSRPDTLIKFADGVWSLVEAPPTAYYDATGSLVDEARPRSKIDFIGVDADGSPVVKYPKLREGDPDTVYRRTTVYEALDPLPDKGYNANGSSRGGGGLADYQGPLAGGGAPSTGAGKYTPAAQY